MAKGASKSVAEVLECQEVTPVNTDEPVMTLLAAERRVLEIQTRRVGWVLDADIQNFLDASSHCSFRSLS